MLKHRTSRLVVLLLLILFILLLSGCGQANDQVVNPSPIPQSPQFEFVGSINSNKYHYLSCEWVNRIYPENKIWFSSPEEAQEAGYVPCKACCPP